MSFENKYYEYCDINSDHEFLLYKFHEFIIWYCTASYIQAHLGLGLWVNSMTQGPNLCSAQDPGPSPQKLQAQANYLALFY